ncbi:MAG: hypothetical protein IJI37_02350 [Opitutales bacterium]|nr:hypothetical protein [Opitutales bacterium]
MLFYNAPEPIGGDDNPEDTRGDRAASAPDEADSLSPAPNVFDMTREELLNFLPGADIRWLRGALLALYDALGE